MDKNKKLIVGIIILVAFLYIVFNISTLLANVADVNMCPAAMTNNCVHKQELDFLVSVLPLIISIAVVVGAGIYYLMGEQMESKEHSLKKNTEILLKFLSQDEQKLVNALIENEGRVLQAEITRLPGMTKVKSHRVVQRLLDRGVIEKDSVGKTNIIRFSKEIKEGLL